MDKKEHAWVKNVNIYFSAEGCNLFKAQARRSGPAKTRSPARTLEQVAQVLAGEALRVLESPRAVEWSRSDRKMRLVD